MVHDPKPSLRHRAHYKMMKKKGSVEVDAVDGQHAWLCVTSNMYICGTVNMWDSQPLHIRSVCPVDGSQAMWLYVLDSELVHTRSVLPDDRSCTTHLLQPHSPVKSPAAAEDFSLPVHPHKPRPPRVLQCQLTPAPTLIQTLIPKVGYLYWDYFCVTALLLPQVDWVYCDYLTWLADTHSGLVALRLHWTLTSSLGRCVV